MDNIRSERHRLIVGMDDKLVKLIRKSSKEEYEDFYQNIYGKIYWIDEDDIHFISNEKLEKYEVVTYE